ncbi:DUF1932 domain-containing protein [Isoptericola aurantiacus]|uniref:DUF1932 domain-containing protein n=1 Tax=Isoptericola aurantiacus TaxID=3377839 RepID=UPI00383ADB6F
MRRVALLGLGEAGRVLAEDLLALGDVEVAAWDVAFGDAGSPAARNGSELEVRRASSAAEAVADAELVLGAVTADQTDHAAQDAATGLAPDAFYLDISSSSPGRKAHAARTVDDAGACYVEAALMASIGPRRCASPFLLGGPHAAAFAAVAASWGLTDVTVVGAVVGRAAATKLCRSVIVKGMEALFTESLLAARRYGVGQEVLDSLPTALPAGDWERLAGYLVTRSVQHGERRAEEMAEAARTVAATGVEPWMSRATVERQRWAGRFGQVLSVEGTTELVDALLEAAALDDSRPDGTRAGGGSA